MGTDSCAVFQTPYKKNRVISYQIDVLLLTTRPRWELLSCTPTSACDSGIWSKVSVIFKKKNSGEKPIISMIPEQFIQVIHPLF